jgi:hypothetical protein
MAEPAVTPSSSFVGNAQQTYNLRQSSRGPLAVPLNIDFSIQTIFDVDLSTIQQNNTIDFVQTLYIDNSGGTAPIIIYCQASQQTVNCPPLSQGYFPFLCPQPVKFLVSSAGGYSKAQVVCLNFPVQPGVWAASAAAVPLFQFTDPGGALITSDVTLLAAGLSGGGYLNVSDVAMDALIHTRGIAPALDVNVLFGGGGGGGGLPTMRAYLADSNAIAATTMLFPVAAQSLEIAAIEVWIDPNATTAAGGYLDWQIRDAGGGPGPFDIAAGRVYVPAAVPAFAAITPGNVLCDITGLNYRSPSIQGTSQLTFRTVTSALATGFIHARVLARNAP